MVFMVSCCKDKVGMRQCHTVLPIVFCHLSRTVIQNPYFTTQTPSLLQFKISALDSGWRGRG